MRIITGQTVGRANRRQNARAIDHIESSFTYDAMRIITGQTVGRANRRNFTSSIDYLIASHAITCRAIDECHILLANARLSAIESKV
jgi:hypothetical protein